MIIFVAGPYSAPTPAQELANTYAAIDAGVILASAGHLPVVPHLNHWLGERAKMMTGDGLPYEFYLSLTIAQLRGCEAMLFLGPSPGANRERAEAERLGLPVFERIEDIPALVGSGLEAAA